MTKLGKVSVETKIFFKSAVQQEADLRPVEEFRVDLE